MQLALVISENSFQRRESSLSENTDRPLPSLQEKLVACYNLHIVNTYFADKGINFRGKNGMQTAWHTALRLPTLKGQCPRLTYHAYTMLLDLKGLNLGLMNERALPQIRGTHVTGLVN